MRPRALSPMRARASMRIEEERLHKLVKEIASSLRRSLFLTDSWALGLEEAGGPEEKADAKSLQLVATRMQPIERETRPSTN